MKQQSSSNYNKINDNNCTSVNDVLPNNNDSNNNANQESFVRPLNTEWITQHKKRGNRNVNGNDDD